MLASAAIPSRRRASRRRRRKPPGGSGPSLAAHWQFADTSRFTRAFKKHYGQTPTEYAHMS
ncbi:AraC family transcriptional regulator [Streptomyces sp. NPDC048297]|uniref:AraC family transcriptional regulator n=1 Tax=Streptomyces sp. NPDC048297 TaxID=3365531 RepID=UPI00371FCF7A